MARTDLGTINDVDLGQRLLAARLAAEAERQGIAPASIPAELAEAWVRQLQTQEADAVVNIPLEKALNLAAKGEFEKAGRIFRAHMLDGAVRLKEQEIVATSRQRASQLKTNAGKGAAARQKFSQQDRAQWVQLAADPEWEKHSNRRRAELIAQKLGLDTASIETIRKAI